MAASGPKAIEVAGEVADGALLLVGANRGIVTRALEHLDRGAKRAGRRVEDLEVIWAVRTATLPTTAAALREARPTAVHWGILRWGGYWLEPAGLKLPPLTVPEAIERADKFLDQALLAEMHEIRLIHGHGTGQLRRALAEFLSDHPLVEKFALAPPNQGGGGVTVVELKD